eukprot:2844419-Rhodomonas_salina.3
MGACLTSAPFKTRMRVKIVVHARRVLVRMITQPARCAPISYTPSFKQGRKEVHDDDDLHLRIVSWRDEAPFRRRGCRWGRAPVQRHQESHSIPNRIASSCTTPNQTAKHTSNAALFATRKLTDLGDLERALAGAESGGIVSLVELAEIHVGVRHRRPQTQRVGVEGVVTEPTHSQLRVHHLHPLPPTSKRGQHITTSPSQRKLVQSNNRRITSFERKRRMRSLPRDGHVVRNGENLVGSVKADGVGDVQALDLPRVTLGQPGVRELDLAALHAASALDVCTPSKQQLHARR